MTSFYSSLASTATKLLTAYGQQLTFTRTTLGDYSPATSTATSSTTTYKGYAAVFNYNTAEVDGDLILSSDLKIVLEKTKQAPQVNDQVAIGGKKYILVGVTPTSPAGSPVKYDCQARAGEKASDLR